MGLAQAFYEVGCAGPFERQAVASFVDDALLERLDEMRPCVAASHFRGLQVDRGEFPGPRERSAAGHRFRYHAPALGEPKWGRSLKVAP